MSLNIEIPEETFGRLLAKAFANRSFLAGFAVTALVVLIALVSFFWTPYDVTKLVIADLIEDRSVDTSIEIAVSGLAL